MSARTLLTWSFFTLAQGFIGLVPVASAGLGCGLFNTFGNVAAITTSIVIGYLVAWSGA